MSSKKEKIKGTPVNTILVDDDLKKLDALVGRDKSHRAAVIRKAIDMLHIITFEKPELYQKIFN